MSMSFTSMGAYTDANSEEPSLAHESISNNPILTDGTRPDQGLSEWKTDFSYSAIPKPCHSHNDYWRPYPLFSALVAGCTSVEADVWLSDDGSWNRLFVGHDPRSFSPARTLRSMYLDPLLAILDAENTAPTWATHTAYD